MGDIKMSTTIRDLKMTSAGEYMKQVYSIPKDTPSGKTYLEIQEMLEEGHRPRVVAFTLEVPIDWVYDVLEELEESGVQPNF